MKEEGGRTLVNLETLTSQIVRFPTQISSNPLNPADPALIFFAKPTPRNPGLEIFAGLRRALGFGCKLRSHILDPHGCLPGNLEGIAVQGGLFFSGEWCRNDFPT